MKTKKMRTTMRACELCKGEAILYCASDNAFLCSHCDTLVHAANFLAARHIRRPLCPSCRTHLSPCPSCFPYNDHDHEDDDDDHDDESTTSSAAASSTSCISSSTSKRPRQSMRSPGVPSRVLRAVLAARLRGGGPACLRLAEERYGVPARANAAAERRLANAFRGRRVEEEGWAESWLG